MLKYYYLDVSLKIDSETENTKLHECTEAFFKQYIINSVRGLFGAIGSAIPFDLLKYDEFSRRGIIRVSIDHYVKIRCGLTLSFHFNGIPSHFEVHKASPLLLSLQGDSREYIH